MLRKRNVPSKQSVTLPVCPWKLATGECYRSIGITFGIGISTAVTICDEVIILLISQRKRFMKLPNNVSQTQNLTDDFF